MLAKLRADLSKANINERKPEHHMSLFSWSAPPQQQHEVRPPITSPSKQVLIEAPNGYMCTVQNDANGNIVISFQPCDVQMTIGQPSSTATLSAFNAFAGKPAFSWQQR
jgi:hypothetical protein